MLGAADKWRTESVPHLLPHFLPHLLEEMRAVLDRRALPEAWDLWQATPSDHPLRPLVALVGHRSAGKSRLLPILERWTGLPGYDLDLLVAERAGKSVASLFAADPIAFRGAEREAFASIRGPAIVATGGGFLSLHADLLRDHTAVLIPISFETYRERLLADRSRPRLRPELSLEAEIAQVYAEREPRHAAVPTMPLVEYLRRTAPPEWLHGARLK